MQLRYYGGINLERLLIKAMAKINLSLDVIRRRDDGYHEVRMIMQTVNLYDELEICEKEESGIEVSCDRAILPCNEHNLVYKAAKLLLDRANEQRGIKITLKKRIPIAAGMAGGSTDAAATLVGINTIYNLGFDTKQLQEMGVKIGADVPYCILGGTALSEGIGEILTPLKKAEDCFVVIVKPDISVSTKFVYENLHVETLSKHPDIDGMIKAIDKKDLLALSGKMENVLETVTIKKYPKIENLKNILKENGALNALMSGSGPTVFGLFTTKDAADKALLKAEETGLVKQGFVTTFINETCGLI